MYYTLCDDVVTMPSVFLALSRHWGVVLACEMKTFAVSYPDFYLFLSLLLFRHFTIIYISLKDSPQFINWSYSIFRVDEENDIFKNYVRVFRSSRGYDKC